MKVVTRCFQSLMEFLQIAVTLLVLGFTMAFIVMILVQMAAEMASAKERTIRIAILDTGLDVNNKGKLKLCPSGHYDFKSERPVIASSRQHGTYVARILGEELKDVDYCAVIFQIDNKNNDITVFNTIRALNMLQAQGIHLANMSISGGETSVAERETIRNIIESGATLFVAAGNDARNFDYECDIFPACYDVPGLKLVGAMDETSSRAPYSNYGSRVKLWFSGKYDPAGQSGTSFATPRALAAYVRSQLAAK